MSKLEMPNGLSEAQQGDWYFNNREQMIEDYLASPEAAKPRLSIAATRFGLPFSIQVQDEDSKLARKQAQQQGVDVEAYTAKLLHEALLARELQRAS